MPSHDTSRDACQISHDNGATWVHHFTITSGATSRHACELIYGVAQDGTRIDHAPGVQYRLRRAGLDDHTTQSMLPMDLGLEIRRPIRPRRVECECCAVRLDDANQADGTAQRCVDCVDNVQCHNCQEWMPYDDGCIDPEDGTLCESCHEELCVECEGSGVLIWLDDAVEIHGSHYSSEYAHDHYFSCADCGDWEDRDCGSLNADEESVCDSCGEHYFHCDGCSETYHEDHYGSDGHCQACEDHDDGDDDDDRPYRGHHTHGSIIKGYSDKSASSKPIMGSDKRGDYMGVELEVVATMGDRCDVAHAVSDKLGHDYATLKEDGSLDNGGFEIVSCRATLAVHADRFTRLLADGQTPRGLRSWDRSCCGMHVHLSRKPITALTLGKMLVFANDPAHEALVTDIAGRKSRFAKFSPKRFTDGKMSSSYDRYSIINVTTHTAEFRCFKGTLKLESFLKNLEFARSVLMFCRSAGLQQLTQHDYLQFLLTNRRDYPNLVSFLRAKSYLPPVRVRSVA